MTTGETIGLPQQMQYGDEISLKDVRQAAQTGTRLAASRVAAQIRQGAGKTTETSASRTIRSADRTFSRENCLGDTAPWILAQGEC